MTSPVAVEAKLPLGTISIDQYLPPVFSDAEVRERSIGSLAAFEATNGDLPLKFRIEEFCFQRPDQICIVDTPNKYLAWGAQDSDITRDVLASLSPTDLPLVLRSHPFTFGMESPVIQVTSMEQVTDFMSSESSAASEMQSKFFGKMQPTETVIQLIKNPYLQKGLLLCRPTFVYDDSLRTELQQYRASDPQYATGHWLPLPDMPEEFAGLRLMPLAEFAREKKQHVGAYFAYNPNVGTLEPRDGFPVTAKWQLDGEFRRAGRAILGRTLDLVDGTTTMHGADGDKYISPDSLFLNPADADFVAKVLTWQLPRIFRFEEEIRQQNWIPQGLTNTHQFVIVPPQELVGQEINTQYFDFHPHSSLEEMDRLAGSDGFSRLNTATKITKFY